MASNIPIIKLKPGISCSLCQRSFSQKSSLTRHISIVHDKLKPHSCIECQQSFSMRDQLKKHIISNHSSSTAMAPIVKVKQAVSCKLCNRSFSQRSSLTRHVIIVHKKLKPHSCSECQQSFSMRDQLKKHIMSNHPAGDFRLYSCSLCNERFSDFKVLQLHKKKHVIQCSQCLRKFSCSQSLKIHTNVVHTKLYSCETCAKYFPSESLLYRHIQTHKADNVDLMSRDEPREYQCELCQTPFHAKMDLDLHILSYHKQVAPKEVVPKDVKPTNYTVEKVDSYQTYHTQVVATEVKQSNMSSEITNAYQPYPNHYIFNNVKQENPRSEITHPYLPYKFC